MPMVTEKTMRAIAIVAIAFSIASLLYYVMGITAFFQRGIDVIETMFLFAVWAPLLIATIVAAIMLAKGYVTLSSHKGVSGVAVLCILASLSIFLIVITPRAGWITNAVRSSAEQITDDGRYIYRLDIVNLFQKNAESRIYVKDTVSGVESQILIDIRLEEIGGISLDRGEAWIEMGQTSEDGIYRTRILHDRLLKSSPSEFFIVDIGAGTALSIP